MPAELDPRLCSLDPHWISPARRAAGPEAAAATWCFPCEKRRRGGTLVRIRRSRPVAVDMVAPRPEGKSTLGSKLNQGIESIICL